MIGVSIRTFYKAYIGAVQSHLELVSSIVGSEFFIISTPTFLCGGESIFSPTLIMMRARERHDFPSPSTICIIV